MRPCGTSIEPLVLTLLMAAYAVPQIEVVRPDLDILVANLSSDNEVLAGEAARTLGNMKTDSDRALAALVQALGDDRAVETRQIAIPAPRMTVSWRAEDALRSIGRPAVPHLSKFVAGANPEQERVRALRVLQSIGPDATASLPAVSDALNDKSRRVRYVAVHAISSIQSDSKRLVPALTARLSDDSPDVRAAAISALARWEQEAGTAIPALQPLLNDEAEFYVAYTPDFFGSRPVRFEAARALGLIRVGADEAIPKLRETMRTDEDRLVRLACAYALCRISQNPEPGLDVLKRALGDRDHGTEIPEWAAQFIGELGPLASSAMPDLSTALQHPDETVRSRAVRAIAKVAPERASSLILPLAGDGDPFVRLAVIEALRTLPEQTDEMIEAYLHALEDRGLFFGNDIRLGAIEALGDLGERASAAVPRLKEIQQSTEYDSIREAAEKALSQITTEH